MSIKIDSNLEYIMNRLHVPESRIDEYKDKSVEEVLLAEAAQGNQAAIELAVEMFTNVDQLIELFQLADPENKLVIIKSMPSYQMTELLELLETEDLLTGLQFFTQDKLLDLVKEIPMEELVKVVFEMFTPQQVIEYMPEEQLDKFLTSEKLDKDLVLKNLQALPGMYLQQIIESVTGEEANGSSKELCFQISQFGDEQYRAALTHLLPDQKRQLTLAITTQHPKMFELFDASAYTKIIGRERDKEDLIKSMGVVKPEYLRKIVDNLPEDLLSIVLTQVDNEKFADMLINQHPELLAKFIAG